MGKNYSVEITTEVKDRGADAILKQVSEIGSGSSVTVGLHEPQSTSLPTLGGEHFGSTTIGEYAKWNEEGALRIPARPFLAPTIDLHAGAFLNHTRRAMGKMSIAELLQKQGERAVKWTQASIRRGGVEQNSPLTVMYKKRRGHGRRPLIYTGSLLNSITYKVRMSRVPNRSLINIMKRAEASLRRVRP